MDDDSQEDIDFSVFVSNAEVAMAMHKLRTHQTDLATL